MTAPINWRYSGAAAPPGQAANAEPDERELLDRVTRDAADADAAMKYLRHEERAARALTGDVEWAPTPADVPRWRREMIDWSRSDICAQLNYQYAATGKGVVLPAATPIESARLAVENERRRLTDADLFFVAPDMVDLVLGAYATMPEYAPRTTDLPATNGFIVFGKPLTSRPLMMHEVLHAQGLLGSDAAERMMRGPQETPVVAAAWGPYDGGTPARRRVWAAGGGLFINFYSPGGITLAGMDPETAARARALIPALSNENEAAFALAPPPGHRYPPGMGEEDYALRDDEPGDGSAGIAVDGSAVAGQTGPWARMLMATFTMMMQPGLAGETVERTPRQQRRRDEREGLAPRDTRIIHLRRAAPKAAPGDADAERAAREWQHQWVVRGHWKNVAYGPARALRRPQWIAPHVKGPDDKPFIGGDKVNVWDRQ